MARNKFIDPAGNRTTYEWQINHSEEGEVGRTRHIESSARTDAIGFVFQQSPSGPLMLRLTGTIFHESQLTEMNAWYDLCQSQSIHFEDFSGDRFEVLVTRFVPVRHRTLKNPRDFANAPYWFWRYEIEMTVLNVISGTWAAA